MEPPPPRGVTPPIPLVDTMLASECKIESLVPRFFVEVNGVRIFAGNAKYSGIRRTLYQGAYCDVISN